MLHFSIINLVEIHVLSPTFSVIYYSYIYIYIFRHYFQRYNVTYDRAGLTFHASSNENKPNSKCPQNNFVFALMLGITFRSLAHYFGDILCIGTVNTFGNYECIVHSTQIIWYIVNKEIIGLVENVRTILVNNTGSEKTTDKIKQIVRHQ